MINVHTVSSLHIAIPIVDISERYSIADGNRTGYGTTYVLDFSPFLGDGSDSIRRPGTCQNRMASDLEDIPFVSLWNYSSAPSEPGHIGSSPFLAYPPSTGWNVSISGECGPVHYHGEFRWFELLECSSFDRQLLNKVIEDQYRLNLSGNVVLSIVSPMSLDSDSGTSSCSESKLHLVFNSLPQDITEFMKLCRFPSC